MNTTMDNDTMAPAAGLVPLSRLSDYDVAAGYPDVRGWNVKAGTDRIGDVDDLIVDTNAMDARYVVIALKHGIFRKARRVVVPIGGARLDEADREVFLDDVDATRLDTLPDYDADRFAEQERTLFSGDYTRPEYSRQRFWGQRPNADERLLVRREESLNIGTRQVSAGEAVVRKTVESERVAVNVPVTHEEISVERHPITPGADLGRGEQLRDEEVRIPLMAEEAVVEKRVVPVEEVVVKKIRVEESQPVETDVRRERVDLGARPERAEGAKPGVKKLEKV